MKTYLISRTALLCSMVCCTTSLGFAQGSVSPPEQLNNRTNVYGYGTNTISYQLDASHHVANAAKLTAYLEQFEGVQDIDVTAEKIKLQFNEVKNEGQLDLIFERIEVLYLTPNVQPAN